MKSLLLCVLLVLSLTLSGCGLLSVNGTPPTTQQVQQDARFFASEGTAIYLATIKDPAKRTEVALQIQRAGTAFVQFAGQGLTPAAIKDALTTLIAQSGLDPAFAPAVTLLITDLVDRAVDQGTGGLHNDDLVAVGNGVLDATDLYVK